AKQFDVAVGKVTREVTGAVQASLFRSAPVLGRRNVFGLIAIVHCCARGRAHSEWVWNESFGREFWPAKIAACDTSAADQKFTGSANPDGLKIRINYIDLSVCYGPTHRNPARACAWLQLPRGGPHSCFGGPIHIQKRSLEDVS